MLVKNLLKRHSYLTTMYYLFAQRGKSANHVFVTGQTGFGKTVFLQFGAEFAVLTRMAKPIFCWFSKNSDFEEMCGMMFPHDIEHEKTEYIEQYIKLKEMPRPFNVAIYVPVTDSMPKTEYPQSPFDKDASSGSGVVPFTIPADDIDYHTFQILYGSQDSMNAYKEFEDAVKRFKRSGKKMSFADFKKMLVDEKKTGAVVKQGFGGVPILHQRVSTKDQTISALISRLDTLEEEGIVSSSDNPYCLKKWLEKELLIQDRTVFLYLGFIKNVTTRYFVLSYFVKSITSLMEHLRYKVDYNIVLMFDEVRSLFPSQHSKYFREQHKGLMDLSAFLTTGARKDKISVWMASQSPSYVDYETMSQFKMKYIFPMFEHRDLAWAEKLVGYDSKQLWAVFNQWSKPPQKYRFLVAGGGFRTIEQMYWTDDHGRRQFGFELPRLPLSHVGKIPLALHSNNPNWEALGIPLKNHVTDAYETLKAEWQEREAIHIKKFERDKKKEREAPKQYEMKMKKDLIHRMIKLEGWNISKICDRLNMGSLTVNKIIDELRLEGKITDDDIEKVAEKTRKDVSEKMKKKFSFFPDFPEEMKGKEFTTIDVALKCSCSSGTAAKYIRQWINDGIVKEIIGETKGRAKIYSYTTEPENNKLKEPEMGINAITTDL